MSKLSGNGFVFFFEQSHTHTVTRSSVELKKKTFHCRFTVYLYRPVCGPVWTITFESNSIKNWFRTSDSRTWCLFIGLVDSIKEDVLFGQRTSLRLQPEPPPLVHCPQ